MSRNLLVPGEKKLDRLAFTHLKHNGRSVGFASLLVAMFSLLARAVTLRYVVRSLENVAVKDWEWA